MISIENMNFKPCEELFMWKKGAQNDIENTKYDVIPCLSIPVSVKEKNSLL